MRLPTRRASNTPGGCAIFRCVSWPSAQLPLRPAPAYPAQLSFHTHHLAPPLSQPAPAPRPPLRALSPRGRRAIDRSALNSRLANLPRHRCVIRQPARTTRQRPARPLSTPTTHPPPGPAHGVLFSAARGRRRPTCCQPANACLIHSLDSLPQHHSLSPHGPVSGPASCSEHDG